MERLYPGGTAAIWEDWELTGGTPPPLPASGSDSDDVDNADEIQPPIRRISGAPKSARNAGRCPSRKLEADLCILEYYRGGAHPLPRDWPREPQLAARFYTTAPAWALLPPGDYHTAVASSPFGMLPDELLHIVLIYAESKSLLATLPVVCRLFALTARREIFWRNVCQIRHWCSVGPPAAALHRRALGRPPRPGTARVWWELTKRWARAMYKTEDFYLELMRQPCCTEWADMSDNDVSDLYKDLMNLPGFGSLGGDDEEDKPPAEFQKTLDNWRDVAGRVDVPLQGWFRMCAGFKAEISMSIGSHLWGGGSGMDGPVFFFPLFHLASATRLTVDMLRRPTEAELRGEEFIEVAEPEPEQELEPESDHHHQQQQALSHIEAEAQPTNSVQEDQGSTTLQEVHSPQAEPHTEYTPGLEEQAVSSRGTAGALEQVGGGDGLGLSSQLATELESSERAVGVAADAPGAVTLNRGGDDDAATLDQPEPKPELPKRRRTRCPLMVTATQGGLGGGGGSAAAVVTPSLLPIAVFLKSQHLICVVLPTDADRKKSLGEEEEGEEGEREEGENTGTSAPLRNRASLFESMLGPDQLVTLQYNGPAIAAATDGAGLDDGAARGATQRQQQEGGQGWSVRPMLTNFSSWMQEVLTIAKNKASCSVGGLYGVE